MLKHYERIKQNKHYPECTFTALISFREYVHLQTARSRPLREFRLSMPYAEIAIDDELQFDELAERIATEIARTCTDVKDSYYEKNSDEYAQFKDLVVNQIKDHFWATSSTIPFDLFPRPEFHISAAKDRPKWCATDKVDVLISYMAYPDFIKEFLQYAKQETEGMKQVITKLHKTGGHFMFDKKRISIMLLCDYDVCFRFTEEEAALLLNTAKSIDAYLADVDNNVNKQLEALDDLVKTI